MDQQKLKEILQKHSLWLRDEDGGEKADLRHCDLTRANLRDANLSSADLRYADLSSANLSSADLSYADLSDANLRYADLRYADLSSADLRSADLRYADLRYADLSSADLRYADLRYADLRSAKNIFLLPVQDPRGYLHPHATLTGQGWQIRVEYHRFSIDQARSHWGESYQGERWIGDMYLHACDWLELMIANNKEVV